MNVLYPCNGKKLSYLIYIFIFFQKKQCWAYELATSEEMLTHNTLIIYLYCTSNISTSIVRRHRIDRYLLSLHDKNSRLYKQKQTSKHVALGS